MLPHSKIWYLENFSMLNVLSKKEILQLDRIAVMKVTPKDHTVYFAGDTSDSLFLLKEGKIKISRNYETGKEVILTLLGPGNMFGESALTEQETRDEVAVALEDALVCMIKVVDFNKFIERNPKLSLQVTKLMGLRLKKLQRRLESMILKTSEERVRDLLKELAADHGHPVALHPNEVVVYIRLTHDDLAKLSATSRQTVTSVLNNLERAGIISYDRRRIYFKQLNLL